MQNGISYFNPILAPNSINNSNQLADNVVITSKLKNKDGQFVMGHDALGNIVTDTSLKAPLAAAANSIILGAGANLLDINGWGGIWIEGDFIMAPNAYLGIYIQGDSTLANYKWQWVYGAAAAPGSSSGAVPILGGVAGANNAIFDSTIRIDTLGDGAGGKVTSILSNSGSRDTAAGTIISDAVVFYHPAVHPANITTITLIPLTIAGVPIANGFLAGTEAYIQRIN